MQLGGLGQALQYAQQPISNYQGLAQLGLGTNTKAFAPKPQGFLQQLLLGLSGGAGQGLGSIGTMWGLNKFGGGLFGSPQQPRG